MKTTNYLIASGTLALALLTATPALADSNGSLKVDGSVDSSIGLHLGSLVRFFDKGQDNGKGKATSTKDNDNDGEHGKLKASGNTGVIGTVSAVNGSVLTIDAFGPKGTTTITTDASTVFKAKGGATSSSAVTVGSHVAVIGTTTSTSTPSTIAASIVWIFGKGFGFFKHLFHH